MLVLANNKEETLALGLEFLMGIRTIQVSKCFVPPSHPLDSILSVHCFVNPQVLDIVMILRNIGIKMCLSKLIFSRVLMLASKFYSNSFIKPCIYYFLQFGMTFKSSVQYLVHLKEVISAL